MSHVDLAVEALSEATREYRASRSREGEVLLEDLGLYVGVRQLQAMALGSMAMFVSEFDATDQSGRMGIVVTCVGSGADLDSAVREAVAQWVVGVLPVLARWRGKHSCLAASNTLETRGGAFELLAGPSITRGQEPGKEHDVADAVDLFEILSERVRNAKLSPRTHWYETFASRFSDGSIEVTCRWNNKEWVVGRELLEKAAGAWPPSERMIRTARRFTMLVPTRGDSRAILQPTLWSRLRGRA